MVQDALELLLDVPPALLYLFIGLGAGVENIIPPIPADTFVLFGGFLAATGRADPLLVFLATWVANVGTALVVYRLSHRYGRAFFRTTAGHWLLHPRQLAQLAEFYQRWGTPAIFLSRFLPGLRAMVPVFAGISHLRFLRVAVPLATASALWYGVLVYLGTAAGRNWRAILERVGQVNDVLLAVAAIVLAAVLFWWIRTRRRRG